MIVVIKRNATLLLVSLLPLLSAQEIVWLRRFDTGRPDHPANGALDPSGNLIICGVTGDYGNHDVTLIKYHSDGETVWVRTYDSGSDDLGASCAVGSDGGVVVGISHHPAPCLLLKYDRDGNLIWIKPFQVGSYCYIGGVVIDESLNIYLSGTTAISSILYSNLLLAKFTPLGESVWVRVYDCGKQENGGQIVLLPDSKICGCGNFDDREWLFDLLIYKFQGNGETCWTRILNIKPQDEAYGITADYEGNLYITGDVWEETQQGIVQPDSFVTARYQPDGTLDWVRVDGLSHYSWGEGIGFDPSGQLLVAGGCYDSILNESSGAILCYSLDGTLLWHWTYRQENWNCRFTDIVIAEPGVCYVIGEVASADNDTSDFLVLKLRYPVGMAEGRPAEVPGGDIAFTTVIRVGAPLRFSLPGAGDYRLMVRDVSGQERVVYAGYLPQGESRLSLPQLPAGVYFLDLAGAGVQSRHRLVVVR